MATRESLEKRISNLENAGTSEDRYRIFVTFEDTIHPKEGSSYIIGKCEAACGEDEEKYYNALGAAFIKIKGENPLEKPGVVYLTEEIALELVEVLRGENILVEL